MPANPDRLSAIRIVLVATVPDCPQHRSLRAVGQLSNQHGIARRELAGKLFVFLF